MTSNRIFTTWLKAISIYFIGERGELTRTAPTSTLNYFPLPIAGALMLYPLLLVTVLCGVWFDRQSLLDVHSVKDCVLPFLLLLFCAAFLRIFWNEIDAARLLWEYAKQGKLQKFPRRFPARRQK